MSADGIAASFSGTLGDFTLDVAFQAPMRGVTALFGPSGSGKTTVLRCVAGLSRLSGRLHVGNEPWQDDEAGVFRCAHERELGYVFQEPSLFPHLSVEKNLLYGRRRTRRGAGRALDAGDVIELLGLNHLLRRSPATLSGGERQRVALGRALLARPRLLLMDEPLSALDRMSKNEILPYFEALHERLSLPILYVSHDISEVARLADTVIVLSAGRCVASGAVQGILERLDLRPETGRFEAGVVLTARVIGHDPLYGLTRLDHHGQGVAIPRADLSVGERVRLRVRARDVSLATRRPEGISMRNVLQGTVTEIVQEGETAFAETLVDIGGGRLRARITREAVAELALAPGSRVYALIESLSFDRRSVITLPTQDAADRAPSSREG